MKNDVFMRCLPLLASMLGRKYGVTVRVGGTDAFTDGKHIQLPALPVDGDNTLVQLVRAYVDHETAHIRFTDFTCLDGGVTPFQKHVWNILEDWRVEECFANRYPGAKRNFQWLIRHLFLSDGAEDFNSPETLILSWLLYFVRSWSVPELSEKSSRYSSLLDDTFPALRIKIETVLEAVKKNCPDSFAALEYAKQILECIANYVAGSANPPKDMPKGVSFSYAEAMSAIQAAVNGGDVSCDAVLSIGEVAQQLIQACGSKSKTESVVIASIGEVKTRHLDEDVMQGLQRVTAGMQARLNSLMQAQKLTRVVSAKKGKLESRNLYRLAVGRSDLFARKYTGETVDTAFHILLDCSGSMGSRMLLAVSACYAVAKALEANDVNVAVTAFPAKSAHGDNQPSIAPLIRHGERVHSKIRVGSRGTTPLTESLWWVLQQLAGLTEERKIVLIVTDGEPDDVSGAIEAITMGKRMEVEFYGLGISSTEIKGILPGASQVVHGIEGLPSAMFRMLEGVML